MASTIDMFEDRQDYHQFDGSIIGVDNFDTFRDPEPIDLWYEKNFYGRVDQRNNAVFIGDDVFASQDKLKMLTDDGIYVLDFVADAFTDLKRRIDNILTYTGRFGGPTISKHSVIRDFTVKKGLVHALPLFEEHIKRYFDVFMKDYLRSTFRDAQVKNFDDFVKFFFEFFKISGSRVPITPSGFVKSQYCSPLISGLMLEISFDDHDDDNKKGEYIDDLNFDFYHAIVKQYGFYVDKNAPWRLVANISSPQMQRYWIRGDRESDLPPYDIPEEEKKIREKCREITEATSATGLIELQYELKGEKIEKYLQPNSVANLFDTYYTRAYRHDVYSIAMFLFEFYNEYVSSFPKIIVEKQESCANQIWIKAGRPTSGYATLSRTIIERKMITEEELSKWSSQKLLKMYISMKAKEEGIKISEPRLDQIMRNASRIFIYFDKKDLDNGHTVEYINMEMKGFTKVKGVVTKFSISEGQLAPSPASAGSNGGNY